MKSTSMIVPLTPVLVALAAGCQSSPTTSPGDSTASVSPRVSPGAADETAPAAIESNTATLWVKGLACPFCVHNVEKQLLRVPGVERVNVVLDTGKVTAALSETTPPSESQLLAAIEDSGFTLDRIEMP